MNDIMSNIKSLRDITGAGFLDCKKALEENNNDIDNSIDFLRKKGLAKANKKSSREANEGAVGIYSNEFTTVIILINTETDFAAKNEVFLNFMDQIGAYALKNEEQDITIESFQNKIFDETSIGDHFKNIIAKIGENIILNKLNYLSKSNNQIIPNYIHNNYRSNIGKIAVAIKADVQNFNEESNKLGKNICKHIAARKPLAMNIDDLDSDLVEKEKNVQLETIKASGKPDNIIDKILDGKMKKFYSESTLLNQSYILDPDKTVSEIISDFSKNSKFDIIEYTMVSVGS